MSNLKPTEVTTFLSDLAGGVFSDQIAAVLSDVADSVVSTGKKGQIKTTLDLSVLGGLEHRQVEVKHRLDYSAPEAHGTRKEDYTRVTPMHVNANGTITLMNEDVGRLFDAVPPSVNHAKTKAIAN